MRRYKKRNQKTIKINKKERGEQNYGKETI